MLNQTETAGTLTVELKGPLAAFRIFPPLHCEAQSGRFIETVLAFLWSFSMERPRCRADKEVFPWKNYIVGATLDPFHGKGTLFGQHSSFSMEKPFCRANIGVFPWKKPFVGPTLHPFRGKRPLLAQHSPFSMEKPLCWPDIGLFPRKDGVVGAFFGSDFWKT
jgi:hypothetical protein